MEPATCNLKVTRGLSAGMRNLIAILALVASGAASAEDYGDILEDAFRATASDFRRHWAFTETATEDGITYVGRYDPGRPGDQPWKLVSVDGREPTEDEIEHYLDTRENDSGGVFGDDIGEIDGVDFDSIELVEETPDYWIFSFLPDSDDEDDYAARVMRDLQGRIKVVRDGPYVEYFDLRNEKALRPAMGMKISRLLTRLTFGPAADGGPIVPVSIDVDVKGRALLFISFDERESIRYSDYELTAP